ncbi:MAG: hypothetical protein M0C28_31765 [Candidatus Moduliflexus flocculans]|nr:hypothetical protein [Candidatus Moduliflexus flocculans]
MNFYIRGILGEGAAASVRLDAQAKTLGEYLRARVVEMPESLVSGVRPRHLTIPGADDGQNLDLLVFTQQGTGNREKTSKGKSSLRTACFLHL